MDESDCQRVTKFTRKIFQGARLYSPETFQDWALDQTKGLIAFDSCKWVTGVIINDQATMHSCHFQNLPHSNHLDYEKHQPEDPILNKLISSRDRVSTFDRYEVTPREEFIKLPIYLEYCRKYGLEHLLSSIVPEPITNLFSVISLGRKNYKCQFSVIDKRIKTIISPVLTEARSHNIFINLLRTIQENSLPAAISDNKGILREAEPGFSELMLEEWPEWQGPLLSVTPEEILNGQREAYFRGEKIHIRISTLHDLVLLQARRVSILDSLTSAEKNITKLLMQGLSDKAIANKLGISPKTVGHHLQSVYRKSGIPSRNQVVVQLKNHSWD